MGLTAAQIIADRQHVTTDLASSGAVETASLILAGGTEISGSFTVLRAKSLEEKELEKTGFASEYKFSVRAIRTETGGAVQGDVLRMEDGNDYRILRIRLSPSRTAAVFDVGSLYEDARDF